MFNQDLQDVFKVSGYVYKWIGNNSKLKEVKDKRLVEQSRGKPQIRWVHDK